MNQVTKILLLSFLSAVTFGDEELITFSEAISRGLKCTYSVEPKLVTIDSSHPGSLEKTKQRVIFKYCAAAVECRGDGFVHSFGLSTEALDETDLKCPGNMDEFPIEQRTACLATGWAEYQSKKHKTQVDKAGIKYSSSVPLMVAHKNEDVEGGWYGHCKITVETSQNDKFIAACPWSGDRSFTNNKGKKQSILQCPGPLDCLRKGFEVDEP